MAKKKQPANKEVVGPVVDSVEGKQAEEALLQSGEQFWLLVNNSRDIIFTLNIKGEFIFVSPAVKEILGYSPLELQGSPFHNIIHPFCK